MSLSEIAVKRPVFAWMLMSALIIFGGISFMRMGVSQLPDVDFPVVSISATLEGAAPEVIETDVVDVIEDAVMTVQGVRAVGGSARQGGARIAVEFDLDKDIDVAIQEIQTKLAQAQRRLPEDIEPPVVTKTNPEDQPIIWLSVRSDKFNTKELMTFVRDHLKDRFSTISGVGEVFLGGYVDPNLRVWISNDKLNRYALTVGDILNTIRNEHTELPAGRIETEKKEFNIRTLGEASSVEEFESIPINTRGGQPNYLPIELGQVARVEEGLADIRRISRTQGELSVGIGIRKQRGSNAVAVAHGVRSRMAEVEKQLPEHVKMAVNFDSTTFIEESVHELNFTLVLSAILTALVCWAFLGSWSSTINVVLAIPTSMIGTFIVLYFSGFTLNTFTLLGLSLAIGIVVDDAIMVLENIVRHYEKGKSRIQAALDGAKEIQFAALAATVAIIAIFLPVVFMEGAIGRFFFQFGVTMTVAVTLSLVEALTLTPMRCSQFLQTGERRTMIGRGVEAAFHAASGGYKRLLAIALAHRWKIVLCSIAVCIASLAIGKILNKEFVPPQDQGRFMVRLQTPVGSSLEYTDAKFKVAEGIVQKDPAVERYFAAVGGFGGGEVNSGIMFITLKSLEERKKTGETQRVVMDRIRKGLVEVPDLKAFAQDLSMRGFTASRGFPLEFTVRGPEWDELANYSAQIIDKLNKTGLVTDVDTDYKEGMPEVRVVPDRKKASMRGVSVGAIAELINATVGGVVAGKYTKGGHRYDIRVRLEAAERSSIDNLKQLFVRNNRGELIPLLDVVHIEQKPTLQVITRRDRERAITVFGNIVAGKSQAAALAEAEKIAKNILPEGYRMVLSGGSESFKESFESLIFALILGLVVSYMVLASQFNSFVDPFTVLMALPFSISGAFIALWLGGQSLNIYSMIGLILLMGIVKKNSILLVDFTNQVRVTGKSVYDSLTEACPMRLRPILMTSMATIAGAVPPALAIGPGAESRIPMAASVIGGVLVSTLLTLFVVPCVYSLFAGIKKEKIHS